MGKIYIVRHCEAEGQGPDAKLTANGMIQREALAEFFSKMPIDQIISSPFTRAIQSIEPLGQIKNLEVKVDERLVERTLSTGNLPDWFEKLRETFGDDHLKFEGGESSKEATERIVAVVEEVIESNRKQTILVTHGNLMALLLTKYDEYFGFEGWKNLTNPDVFALHIEEADMHLERIWRAE